MNLNIFDNWNKLKQNLQAKQKCKKFKERDIVFLHIGENIGFEQNGKGEEFLRPVLVYKKFSSTVFLGIPLTSQKKDSKFYYNFQLKNSNSTAILSQIKLFDSKRIKYFYARLNEKTFLTIKEKLIELLQ